ncbi:hypothetical protein AQUCO_06800037v1 [Aquilegia coerulea]|uniref:non-specific serine/threonine protein kinase n=1 Tax=Aquilegia coerulea TaxID=218851 RepID=A0A2G5CBG5_AQUCA|nr:hypothetical protein AQUCO_06800037v1 [Aquilegia coerulea]
MGVSTSIGKYRLCTTIGEGTFSKVKLAMNTETHQKVAIKIIDKEMIMENNLKDQVKREIRTMKLLRHPNIVGIHEVIGTKTKIYIVMEYVPGGRLLDKLTYLKRLSEEAARQYFQQLIDVVDYCHCRNVYHRDLKLENLLVDGRGNLKVSDFGLSAIQEPGELLSTSCGSPSYVAPEVIAHERYDGAAADVWSCGIILFELLAGYLPFHDCNLWNLYRKISRAKYAFPKWFTASQRCLILKILNPNPSRRMTVADILEDEWFQINYKSHKAIDSTEHINVKDKGTAFNCTLEKTTEIEKSRCPSFINAFQLIAMSYDLDLSGLFLKKNEEKRRSKIGSKHPINGTIEKIKIAAKNAGLSVEKLNNSKVKLHHIHKLPRCSRSYFNLSAEVIEVTPTNCVVEISNSEEDLTVYKEFCQSLSRLLKECSRFGGEKENNSLIKELSSHSSSK